MTNRYLQAIQQHSLNSPNQVAIEDLSSGTKVTYLELFENVKRITNLLQDLDASETIALTINTNVETAIAYLGIVVSGRTVAAVDEALSSKAVSHFKTSPLFTKFTSNDLVALAAQHPVSEAHPINFPPAHDIESLLFTSGSTGEPKIFGIPSDRPNRDIFFESEGDRYTVLNIRRASTTPFKRNISRALLHGGRFLTFDMSLFSATEVNSLLGEQNVTEISVTPTMIRTMFTSFTGRWTETVKLVSINGERAKREDLVRVFEAMPNTRIRKNYGSTEFGNLSESIIDRQQLEEEVDPISVGFPTVDLQVVDEEFGLEVSPGTSGKVVVKGIYGAIGDFNDDGSLFIQRFNSDTWHDTGDIGFINEKSELVILERREQTLKIRGSRISLLEIEEIMKSTGLIEEVLVAPYEDIDGNTSLGALVVAANGVSLSLADIRRKIVESHPLVKCPTRILSVDSIPLLVSGKVDRLTARRMLTEDRSTHTGSTSQSATLKVLRDLTRQVMPSREISITQDLFEAGLDSIGCLELLHAMSEAFGFSLDVRILLQNPTVQLLSNAIENYMEPHGRIVPIADLDEELFADIYWILPGANPFMIQRMAFNLPQFRHLGVLNHGSLPDEILFPEMDSMIHTLVEEIKKEHDKQRPFFVGGFSSACYLASEITHRLIDSGCVVSGVVLLDPSQSIRNQQPAANNLLPNPLHLMLAREGRLSLLDPVQRDHALFGLQVYVLGRNTFTPLHVPVLQISSQQIQTHGSLWANHSKSKFVTCNLEHLDFLRKPEVISEEVNDFLMSMVDDLLRN